MKFIPIPELEEVSAALNFEKHGMRLEGSCDIWSVKLVKEDKKLYKYIDKTLNQKHQEDLRLAASLPKEYVKEFAATANLSRASPFGAFSRPANMRKYAHLIAVLNSTHTDHDFSHVLRPNDFIRIRSLDDAIKAIDHKLYTSNGNRHASGLQTPGGCNIWNPKMWDTIDAEMDLDDCEIYKYQPETDPFVDPIDGSTSYWDMHYFFVNVPGNKRQQEARQKQRARQIRKADSKPSQKTKSKVPELKTNRVCYLYLRASRMPTYLYWSKEENDSVKRSYSVRDSGDFSLQNKRAKQEGEQADDIEETFYHVVGDLDTEEYEDESDSSSPRPAYDDMWEMMRRKGTQNAPIVIEE